MTTQSRVADRRASPTLLEFHHLKQVSLSLARPDGDDHQGQRVASLEMAGDIPKARKKRYSPSNPGPAPALGAPAISIPAFPGKNIDLMTLHRPGTWIPLPSLEHWLLLAAQISLRSK